MRERKIITLIGMSGVGKSFWSKKLKDENCKIFSIDDLIAQKLKKIIHSENGDENVKYGDNKVGELARWMGFPGDKRYEQNCKKYLKLEQTITLKSLKEALKSNTTSIIDTTGSVIYLDKVVQSELRKHTRIIYLDISNVKLKEIFKTFCQVPKPIIWGNLYKAKANETELETLKRCYKNLLDFRKKKYISLAHKTVPYLKHRLAKTSSFLLN